MDLQNTSVQNATQTPVPQQEQAVFANAITNGRFVVEAFTSHDNHAMRYGKLINPNRPVTDKALLFLPGLGGSVKGALFFLNSLLPHYSCIYAPDLRGYGLNRLESPLHNVYPIIDDLEFFHQNVMSPEHQATDLCGISLGGVLATLLATKYQFHSKGYEKLALLVPAFKASSVKFTTEYLVKNVAKRYLLGQRYTDLPYGIESLTQNPLILNHPEYADRPRLSQSVDYLLHVKHLSGEALKNTAKLELPTLIAVADKDFVCDPVTMRLAFQRIPSTTEKKLLEYPNLYHDILLEPEAPEIGHQVAQWFNQ